MSFTHEGGSGGLSDVTFEVAPSEVVAITGSASCGKSTLLDLLFRLREPTSGHILLDDFDLADLRLDVLRQHIALVRDVEVLSGTLAENVHLGREEITTSDVRTALQRVGLENNLADVSGFGADARRVRHVWSLDTQLAGNGRPLSESQIWRLMLARALAGRPRLLLIDGLFDSLPDGDAEELLEELKHSRETCSVLLVTGRKSLAAKCDRVWELSR